MCCFVRLDTNKLNAFCGRGFELDANSCVGGVVYCQSLV